MVTRMTMKFNVNKCKVMHYGSNNPSYEYLMNDEVLIDTEKERDLGVTKSLKPSCHIAHCVKMAHQMLGMIRMSFHYKNRKTMLLLYKSIVRPHLEYEVQVWCPNKISDIKLLEGVQR